MALPITFLSDYGLEDEFVGICHAVIARHCPEARVIDLGHGIPPGDIRQGALRLADALALAPAGVHLAVVDPGVGSTRRPVAIRCRGEVAGSERLLVGPDNGLLWAAAERFGGPAAGFDLAHTPVREEPVSATFHGRDIFAPAAAHLASGTPPEALGDPVDVVSLTRLDRPVCRSEGGALQVEVIAVDRFGNASLAALPEDLAAAGSERHPHAGRGTPPSDEGIVDVETEARLRERVPLARTFGDVARGEPVLITDSSGRLALAINGGSAAERFGLEAGSVITLTAP